MDKKISQKEKILGCDWDLLAVTDACRYDYFKNSYNKFFEGDLTKARSPGSMTQEWVTKTFGDEEFKDVVYVSGNPWVNSEVKVQGSFDGTETFHDVIDVWAWGWDEELGTVPPETINTGILKAKDKYPGKKIIAHYIQPHSPYINLQTTTHRSKIIYNSLDLLTKLSGRLTRNDSRDAIPFIKKENEGREGLRTKIDSCLNQRLTPKTISRIKKITGLPPRAAWDVLYRLGTDTLRNEYINDLELVLESIADVSTHFDTTVITADHGEYLGEPVTDKEVDKPAQVKHEGELKWVGHPRNSKQPVMRDVPWFEIHKTLTETGDEEHEKIDSSIDKDIRRRLKQLGYK